MQASGFGIEPRRFDAAVHERLHADGANFEFQAARFDSRKFQQIIREPGQPPRVFADNFDEAFPIGLVVQRAAEKRFGKALNRGQRRLEFVRDIGNKIAPHPLQPAQFRDVVQHQNGAIGPGGAYRRRCDAEISAPHRADFDLASQFLHSRKACRTRATRSACRNASTSVLPCELPSGNSRICSKAQLQ